MYKSLVSRLLRKTGIILKRSISLQPLLTACIDQDGRAANGVVNVLSTLGFREEENRPSQSDLRLVGGGSVDCWLEKNRLKNYGSMPFCVEVDKTKLSSSLGLLAACDHRLGISVAVKGVRSTAQRTLEGSRNAFMLKGLGLDAAFRSLPLSPSGG